MNEAYIKSIYIEKVRHLEKVNILLSDTEKKHLILTGKNGSGKTSLLDAMAQYLRFIEQDDANFPDSKVEEMNMFKTRLSQLKTDNMTNANVEKYRKFADILEKKEVELPLLTGGVQLDIENQLDCVKNYNEGKYIVCYLKAKRKTMFNNSTGVQKIKFKSKYKLSDEVNQDFVKYLVDLKTQQAYAKNENDYDGMQYYDKWFNKFESILKNLYEDDGLILHFDYKNYDFQIVTSDHKKFRFNEMSDGYSALFEIISEVMTRMEYSAKINYDVQGIVMIDELETHLHVDLQKNILPMLISLFPKIQFIITTHSPFILSSISNSVVYDLDTKERIENLSRYSYENIVENYFQVDKFSDEISNFIKKYEELVEKLSENKNQELINEMEEMDKYLETSEYDLDDDLMYHYKKLVLRKKVIIDG